MTKKEMQDRIDKLEKIIVDTFWMSRRYAHGRRTYAPAMVRWSYKMLKLMDIEIKHDEEIKPPDDSEIGGMRFRTDYLDDCND